MPKIELPRDWTCNGSELKPRSGSSADTYVYQGGELKKKYNASSSDIWVFNGTELKKKYNASSRDIWVVSGGKIKPKYNSSYSTTYDLGSQPILVAFGQLILRLW